MKREAWGHRKILKLARRLHVDECFAVGILESLWRVTDQEAPTGDIGKLSNEDIALAIRYTGDADELVGALEHAGWIDANPEHRLIIHDWHEHCEEAIHRRLARSRQYFADGSIPNFRRLESAERKEAQDFYVCERAQESRESAPGVRPTCAQDAPGGAGPVLSCPVQSGPVLSGPGRGAAGDDFQEFRSVAEAAGMTASEIEWNEARQFGWKPLDFEQKLAAVAGIRDRMGTDDPAIKSLPKNYLEKHKWERAIRVERSKPKSALESMLEKARNDRQIVRN